MATIMSERINDEIAINQIIILNSKF
jgi:hypothetical protein